MNFSDDGRALPVLADGDVAGKPLEVVGVGGAAWGAHSGSIRGDHVGSPVRVLLGVGEGALGIGAGVVLHAFLSLDELCFKFINLTTAALLAVVGDALDAEGDSCFHFGEHLADADEVDAHRAVINGMSSQEGSPAGNTIGSSTGQVACFFMAA